LRKGIHDEEIKTRGGEDLSKAKEYDETWIEAICSSVSQKAQIASGERYNWSATRDYREV
jgi:hypothetical protein